MTEKPRILVLDSGSATGGGLGFRRLVEESLKSGGDLQAKIVGVASNHKNGGVRKIADDHNVPFVFLKPPFTGEKYQALVGEFHAGWVACSGWLKLICGLDPAKTFNIHPGPLPKFGGQGMYGHHVHEAVMHSYSLGARKHSSVCMHFVNENYDHGPVFFDLKVPIEDRDTPDNLGARVNQQEHIWQPFITNLVVHGQIRLVSKFSIVVPNWYKQQSYCPHRWRI